MLTRTLLIISILYGGSALGKYSGQATVTMSNRIYLGHLVPFHRYVQTSNRHFYTTNAEEIGTTFVDDTEQYDFKYEKIACQIFDPKASQPANTVPLYRFVSQEKYYFYTTSLQEFDTNVPDVSMDFWKSDGIAGYVYSEQKDGTVPFYRYYNSLQDEYFYTTNAGEIGTVTPGAVGKGGYKSEGIAAYVIS
ncbi:unnamed protein product [Rotaria socialis]|uniref:DUF5648 domain-containing protein n=1 Tax=Rotaria socialis TaxID=392032 RepID=A0A817P3C7_9BILA|nr:unnamed protein product [Rotaria socialis]CAF3399385.1 unnamed protein product [Rotaria socialis]CAF3558166.1 unnamed protein product [Rotaria socialis]CAF4572466.1 unnamed protein product [Rotaria socialis]CAF4600405.1 unnamed protein product [Rotaria socialis]